MPFYDYQCPKCQCIKEDVMHTISEVDNPSPETIKEITCHCIKKGVRMLQAFTTAIAIKTPTINRMLNESRKKRNKDHFKKEVLPTLGRDEVIHHEKKAGKRVNTKKMGLVG